ncbi:hypothetical protein ZYGR_0N00790 [Zygosaccharomyces rouxii]|uniref:Phosphatidylinositol transfer protein SFH5 n=2 Tax=Zygosaccharomyces rouxii TaxID=4956 RepID=C5DUX8_ZYGRC|nr:uncharacterized protein ZYRO0D02266g [Zygosaccharomyces rouxii]KAH9200513.1 CRAL-TRIO domain-containing protein [Zygosaccharomyces rouxii]GAV48675.1 hypothetical protein ZYGR_0N00790 [Zygosaccharomyces rouxii]CAR27597.1 ZYRO0D02266p [Zygosaccharomyces rouxii]
MAELKFENANERKVFEEVFEELPQLIKTKCKGYDELYGYKLNFKDEDQQVVKKYYDEEIAKHLIFKICKAFQFNKDQVTQRIVDVLNWRREFNPLSAAFLETHNPELEEVGVITQYPEESPNKRVVTWNLYGQLVKRKELFKDADKFIRYRIGLMEKGLRLLQFQSDDNNYMTQVHDYKGVSVFRMDGNIKKCTKQVISIFQQYYPELLWAKYFVNVPAVFSWVYGVVKQFVDEQTMSKFVVLSDGKKLSQYLKSAPSDYGGKQQGLKEQNIQNVRPTEYGLYLLEKQNNEDID